MLLKESNIIQLRDDEEQQAVLHRNINGTTLPRTNHGKNR